MPAFSDILGTLINDLINLLSTTVFGLFFKKLFVLEILNRTRKDTIGLSYFNRFARAIKSLDKSSSQGRVLCLSKNRLD